MQRPNRELVFNTNQVNSEHEIREKFYAIISTSAGEQEKCTKYPSEQFCHTIKQISKITNLKT